MGVNSFYFLVASHKSLKHQVLRHRVKTKLWAFYTKNISTHSSSTYKLLNLFIALFLKTLISSFSSGGGHPVNAI